MPLNCTKGQEKRNGRESESETDGTPFLLNVPQGVGPHVLPPPALAEGRAAPVPTAP